MDIIGAKRATPFPQPSGAGIRSMLSLDGILLANPWPARTKWAIFLGILGIYVACFRFLEQEVGPMAAIFVTMPVLFGAWLFGWRGGVGAGLASSR